MLSQLPDDLTDNGIVAVGYSLGGAMLLKYLGEEGSFSPLRAAATICAPIDLKRTCQHMMRPRNWLYHNYILTDLKKEALAEGARLSAEEREIVRSARSVRDYDDRFISPRYGFRGADDYYELCAPLDYMPGDPRADHGAGGGRRSVDPGRVLSRLQMGRTIRSLLPVIAEGGGHLGFHGDGSDRPWCDLACWRNSSSEVAGEL